MAKKILIFENDPDTVDLLQHIAGNINLDGVKFERRFP